MSDEEPRTRSNLDMLLDLDEPELFVREVHMRALDRLGDRPRAKMWQAIADGARLILDRLEVLNGPRAKVEGEVEPPQE